MDAETFGGFCSLLIEQWLDPSGSLDQDDEQLRLLARMSAKSWAKCRKQILALFSLNEDDRLSCEIVSEALERAQSRSESARKAVEIRESRKVESEKKSPDKRKKIEGSSNSEGEGEGKSEGKGKKLDGINPSSSYPETFEGFWLAWKKLGSKRGMNKAGSYKSWLKAVAKGVTPDTLIQAVNEYGLFIDEREKVKKDMREFIPDPETWLNQDRWSSEYPQTTTVSIKTDPVNGRDFYWAEIEGEGGVSRMTRLKIVDGKRTEDLFDEQKWRNQ